jgi:hypothetical protein
VLKWLFIHCDPFFVQFIVSSLRIRQPADEAIYIFWKITDCFVVPPRNDGQKNLYNLNLARYHLANKGGAVLRQQLN